MDWHNIILYRHLCYDLGECAEFFSNTIVKVALVVLGG